MKALVTMNAVGVLSWAAVAMAVGDRGNPEVLYGMLGPLIVAVVSWALVKQAFDADPSGVMRVLLTGMAVKLMFFAAYAVVMLRVFELRPIPFVTSFTCYFIALHNIEALFMRRLFTSA